MPKDLKAKMSKNERKKGKKDWEKFGYKVPNNSRGALLLDNKNGNNLWADTTSKDITELHRLGLFQLYPPRTNFENKDGWKYSQMHIIFDVKQKDLRNKARIVVGGHVMYSMEHTTYS